MPNGLHPHTTMSLGGLSLRQVAVGIWKRMEEHDAMTWAAAVAFYAMLATVPFLALVLVSVVLRLPDLSGAGRRTTGLGNLTVDQLEATLRSLFPNEAYVLVRDQIARIQGEPPLALLSLGAVIALWSASNLFLVVIDALNRTYGVDAPPDGLPGRVARGDRRLAADSPGTRLGPQWCGGMGGDGCPMVCSLPDGTPELRPDIPRRPQHPALLGLGHAGEPGGNHRLPGFLHPLPPLRPELRPLQVVGSARRGHGAVVLVLGRGAGAPGRGRNG